MIHSKGTVVGMARACRKEMPEGRDRNDDIRRNLA
jgi:hypothetical protein